MCRYAFKKYKTHFVCFDCRKTFKKLPVEYLAVQNGDWKDYQKAFWSYSSDKSTKYRKENPERVNYLIEKYRNRKEKCPQCGSAMVDLGLDFKAPRKEKVQEWEIVRGLYKSGKSFHSCGCNGIGFIPKKKDEYRNYLLTRRENYQARIDNRDALAQKEQLSEYLSRFDELIKMIDQELEALDTG